MMNKPDSGGPKKSALNEFMKKNKSMVFLMPILLIGIVVVVVMYSKPQNKPSPPSDIPSSGTVKENPTVPEGQDLRVEVLPQMERVKQPGELNLSQIKDPFEAGEPSVFLKGVVLSDKTDTAIIETQSRAYIVSVGDSIDSYWNVEKIEDRKVTLKDRDGNDLVLTLN